MLFCNEPCKIIRPLICDWLLSISSRWLLPRQQCTSTSASFFRRWIENYITKHVIFVKCLNHCGWFAITKHPGTFSTLKIIGTPIGWVWQCEFRTFFAWKRINYRLLFAGRDFQEKGERVECRPNEVSEKDSESFGLCEKASWETTISTQ